MLLVSVGLTAIEVSLCGPIACPALEPSQSVLTFAAVDVAVVQIAVPVFTAGPVPNTAPATGAGASLTLWTNFTGCGSPSPSATPAPIPTVITAAAVTITAVRARDKTLIGPPFSLLRPTRRGHQAFPFGPD